MSYLKAASLGEALHFLADSQGCARIIAGATDLYLQGMPERALDITGIPEVKGIVEKEGLIALGSAVTHSEAESSILVQEKALALAEACAHVGSPQIRNIGTIGGNVINAAPAADAAVALVALGAKAIFIDLQGETREIEVEDLYESFNCTRVDCSREIMLRMVFRGCSENEGSAFARFASRGALALPMVNAAARVKVVDGLFQDVRLVLAPVKPAPTRLVEVEKLLQGATADEETYKRIEAAATAEVEVRSSLLRCTAEYRTHLVGVLASRVIRRAVEVALDRKRGA